MSISPASFGAAAVTEQASKHDVQSDHDRSPNEFAGVLAGVVQSSKKPLEPKKPEAERTSDLDRPDEAHEGEKTKRARGTSHDASDSDDAKTAATAATPLDDPSQAVVQSVSALDPQLQAKLARVMSRMRDETGHDVQVAETFRTQARQDALFAQGRDTPGNVVTWTQNSKHTQGRAVDLVLDNGTAGTDAYTTLQRIANEEGLRTLGPRDPGHLELPGAGANGTDTTSLNPAQPADVSGSGQMPIARIAQIAQVSQLSVAAPAQVASVATVGRGDTTSDATRTMNVESAQPSRAPHQGTTPTVQAARGVTGDAQNASHRFSGDSSDRDGGSNGDHRGYSALAAAVALRDAAATATSTSGVSSTASMTPAERVAKMIAAFDDAPPRPLSQITMSVDAGNGTADRVQLAMRGSSLNATIDAADARAAQTMTSKSDELVRALSRDGIDLEALRVRAVAGATTTQAVAPQSSSQTNTNSRFERGNAWQQQQDRQRSQDDRRQQQRDQRGGQKK